MSPPTTQALSGAPHHIPPPGLIPHLASRACSGRTDEQGLVSTTELDALGHLGRAPSSTDAPLPENHPGLIRKRSVTRVGGKLSSARAHAWVSVRTRGTQRAGQGHAATPGAAGRLWPGPGGGRMEVARYLHAQDRQVRKRVQVLKFRDLVFPQK